MNTFFNTDVGAVNLFGAQQKVKKMGRNRVSDSVKEEAVRRIIEDGERVADIARELGVSKNTVHNWKTSYNKLLKKDLLVKQLKESNEQLESEKSKLLKENEHLEYTLNKFREMLREEMRSK